jgi:hypothetical protein
MIRKLTPEDVYQEWHRATFFAAKGICPRRVQNFEAAKAKSSWVYFVKFADMCNRTQMIDYKDFIKILAEFHEGRFAASELIKAHSIKIYKNKINYAQMQETLAESIKRSFMFVKEYMAANSLEKFEDYFNEGGLIIPTFIKHLRMNKISRAFLDKVPYAQHIIVQLPEDIKHFINGERDL